MRHALRRARTGFRSLLRVRGPWAGLLCAGLGAFSVLGFAPFHVFPAYVAALSALYLLLDRAQRAERPARASAWRGFAFGFGQFLAGTFWTANAFLVSAQDHAWLIWAPLILLPAGLALFPAAAAAAFSALPRRIIEPVSGFALCFFLAELLRASILSGFPWNLPAHVWPAGGPVSQSAALIGATGLGFFTLYVAAAPAALAAARTPRARWAPVVLAAGLLIAANVYGGARLGAAETAQTDVRLRIVTLNQPQAEKTYEARAEILERYLGHTSAPGLDMVDTVIWPEGAIPALFLREPALIARTAELLRGGPLLITGTNRAEFDPDGEPVYFNSLAALSFAAEGPQLAGVYDKARLVPFGETNPAAVITEILGFSTLARFDSGFAAGPGARTLALAGLPAFQPLICYEVIYPRFARSGDDRPAFLLNISNDSWFGHSSGPLQHFNQARFRAIETGLPLVRAAASGISGQVDPYGRSVRTTRLSHEGGLDVQLLETVLEPIYAKYGVWCWFSAVLLFFAVSTASHAARVRR